MSLVHCYKPNKVYVSVIVSSIILITVVVWCILPYDYDHIRRTTHCDTTPRSTEKYLVFPMWTIISGSGLGNQLFEIFSLLGMAQKLNRTAIFNKRDWFLRFRLRNVHMKIPKISDQVKTRDIEPSESTRYTYSPACCEYNLPSMLPCEQSKFLVIDGNYFQSFKYFSSMESTIREWLTPTGEEREYLNTMINQEDVNKHKICVHIRRGDFLTDGNHAGTEKDFTLRAIDYLQNLKPGVILIFSNEQKWVATEIADQSQHKRDIRIMPTPMDLPFKDLYFSQIFCDVVLITAPSSTFGWWIGYLSRNQTNVYYRDIREMDDPVKYQMVDEDFFPEKWKKLGFTRSNGTVFLKDSWFFSNQKISFYDRYSCEMISMTDKIHLKLQTTKTTNYKNIHFKTITPFGTFQESIRSKLTKYSFSWIWSTWLL